MSDEKYDVEALWEHFRYILTCKISTKEAGKIRPMALLFYTHFVQSSKSTRKMVSFLELVKNLDILTNILVIFSVCLFTLTFQIRVVFSGLWVTRIWKCSIFQYGTASHEVQPIGLRILYTRMVKLTYKNIHCRIALVYHWSLH